MDTTLDRAPSSRAAARHLIACLLTLVLPWGIARAQCDNPIECENQLPGNPPSEWDITGTGDFGIQGYASEISVDQGETVEFKIKTDATDYRVDIYRLGYYGGDGARFIATVEPSAALPQAQPACDVDAGTRLLDCGVWNVSASWTVPPTATSGVYIAKLVREDPEDGRASHIVFIVRDDDGGSDILLQTDDTTWQAYNQWSESGPTSGNSLYGGPGGQAYKVSYNRPFGTRTAPTEDWVFNATYPMIRWLERNGYDVSYCSGIDTDRLGAELLEHEMFVSVGHDEYWSRAQRDAVTAARNAGVDLAFFSGNEVYWKVRWEDSIDGSATPYRTMVCYKEGLLGENQCGTKCDPVADVWTGLWRSGCAWTPPADGCEPENALSGQISWQGTTHSMDVPALYKNLPFWRNTSISTMGPEETATLSDGVLGYEWDWEQETYASSYPAQRMKLSTSVRDGLTHHLSLYRHASGALVFGAGTVQWSWGLDGVHDRGGSVEDARMQQATVNLLADMGVQPASLQVGLTAATPLVDIDPPTSAILSPVDASSVELGTPVTVTGTAADVGPSSVGLVEISVDGGTTWLPADGLESWSYEWTPETSGPATILSRAMDGSFNVETPGPGIAVTVEERQCPCSIWADTTIPGTVSDPTAVEVGVKISVDTPGYIIGLRFYKGVTNTGTHTGHLWLADGTLLASQVFVGESAEGWQEVALDNPVAVSLGTTYVASYHTPSGDYAFSGAYFTSAVDNPPLRALADGEDGPNGVYVYSASSAFPTDTFNASNYWVDVVFSETATDETPPGIVARMPAPGASGVSAGTTVTATFDEPVNDATIGFELRDPSTALVAATLTYDAPTRTATLTPDAALAYDTTYESTVSGVEDIAGNPMPAPEVWTFTTGGPPPPPPDEGPGGPILVIADVGNPFGRFFAEILRSEGLNAFSVSDISLVTPIVLDDYDVVILGDMASRGLTSGEVTMLTDWVTAGGNLVAMRPDAQLAGLLGLTVAGGTLDEGYLLVDTGSSPGTGIVGETIQYHGTADLYTLSGATAVATLYSDAMTATASPAVTLVDVGGNGGQAAAFTYDLARSVVTTRQGNPAWSGQERDGTSPIRSDDLYYGDAVGDPQLDWVDLDKVAIPQADEQQRLLANLVLEMNRDVMPLPRFWYFPGRAGTEAFPEGFEAVVIMTGDEHGCCGGTESRFDIYLAESPPGCNVDDWECVRASSYVYTNSSWSDATALSYHNQGFEIGMHLNTGCADWTESSLDADYIAQLATFAAQFPSLPVQDSHRTHCIAWSDYATQPKVEYAHGIRLDVNYYYWPGSWILDRPGMFTGSGMPMRFADLDGTMIDVYQAASQLTDESDQNLAVHIAALLDAAVGPEQYYGTFTANMHTDQANHAGSNTIVAAAQARGVPVVSGRQMLRWLDGRNASAFASLDMTGNTLSFTVTGGTGSRNLQSLLPTLSAVGSLVGLTRDGSPVDYTMETVKGVEYARFFAPDGAYEAAYDVDATPPAITNVAASPGGGGMASITWDTDEPADSRVDYGTDPGNLDQSESVATLVTSHDVTLSGLPANTMFHYRVTSADALANSATEPEPPSAPLSFLTADVPCVASTTSSDFEAGTTGPDTYVAETDDGEVILAPTEGAEFGGASLPAGWSFGEWVGGSGGSAVVSGGTVTVDGGRVLTDATYGPAVGVEMEATFGAAMNQHVGLSDDFNSTWAIFSTKNTTTNLFYRTNPGGTEVDLGPGYVGAAHRYRVEWSAGAVDFYIDDVKVNGAPVPISTGTPNLQPIASDFDTGGGTLVVDWARMSPYATSGTYESEVFDGGTSTAWGQISWVSGEPAGTAIAMEVRIGDTAIPDGSWTSYASITSGANVGGSSQYVQYRASLSTTDTGTTPALESVEILCIPGADETPPVITNVMAVPEPSGTTATITWDTNELADSRVDYGTNPGALTSNESSAPLVAAHALGLTGLTPGTVVYYRVRSADAAANSATEPEPPAAPLSFTTPLPACFADVSAADFAAGTLDGNVVVTETTDGEVALVPAVGDDFFGTTVPVDWYVHDWAGGGGTATVGSGEVTLDATRINPLGAGFGPGRRLEFVATFAGAAFQHVGFGGGNDAPPNEQFNTSPWAMFSTGTSGTTLQARTWDGVGAPVNVDVPGSWFGAPHAYRIDWGASAVDFYVDGALVHTETVAIAGPMRPGISDLTAGGAVLSVDWLRMSPYATSGTFLSRVYDAGSPVIWDAIEWTSAEPTGTSLAVSVRTGGTPVPDGSWTAFAPAVSGGAIGAASQYIQYAADLGTTDDAVTPVLDDVSVHCAVCDTDAPEAIADLSTTQVRSGNDASGTTEITVSWTAPVAPDEASVEVYRKPHGDYPTYAGGSVPSVPADPGAALAAGWTLVASVDPSTTSLVDGPPARDVWYYIAYAIDTCTNVSAASGLAEDTHHLAPGTLDYHLGDVTDGIMPGTGDNEVDGMDLSTLGGSYGLTGAAVDPVAYLDVGPTVGGSVYDRSVPDAVIGFDDLILFAVNYGTVGPAPIVRSSKDEAAARKTAATAIPLVELMTEPVGAGEVIANVRLLENPDVVKGFHVVLAYEDAEVVAVEPGDVVSRVDGPVFFRDLAEAEGVGLHGARLRGDGFEGDGTLAKVRFAVGDALRLRLVVVDLRDAWNRTLGEPAPDDGDWMIVPTRYELIGARPNPFNPQTRIVFRLPEVAPVRIRIFDVGGRLLRRLADGTFPVGEHAVVWDGRTDGGARVGSGVYFYSIRAGRGIDAREKLVLLK